LTAQCLKSIKIKIYQRVAQWLEIVDSRLGFDSLAESEQKILKVGIHSFPA